MLTSGTLWTETFHPATNFVQYYAAVNAPIPTIKLVTATTRTLERLPSKLHGQSFYFLVVEWNHYLKHCNKITTSQ